MKSVDYGGPWLWRPPNDNIPILPIPQSGPGDSLCTSCERRTFSRGDFLFQTVRRCPQPLRGCRCRTVRRRGPTALSPVGIPCSCASGTYGSLWRSAGARRRRGSTRRGGRRSHADRRAAEAVAERTCRRRRRRVQCTGRAAASPWRCRTVDDERNSRSPTESLRTTRRHFLMCTFSVDNHRTIYSSTLHIVGG